MRQKGITFIVLLVGLSMLLTGCSGQPRDLERFALDCFARWEDPKMVNVRIARISVFDLASEDKQNGVTWMGNVVVAYTLGRAREASIQVRVRGGKMEFRSLLWLGQVNPWYPREEWSEKCESIWINVK